MKQKMVLEVGLFAEASVTHITSERPRTIVHVHVGAEIPGGRERFLTQRTLVGLLLEK